MRRLRTFSFALLVPFFMPTPEATANPIVDIRWTATSGAGTVGTNAIQAAPGDTLTAGLFVDLMAGDFVAGYGISVRFDQDLGNELDLVSATELLPFAAGFLFNATAGVHSITESTAGTGGEVLTFEALTFFPVPTPSSFQIGEISFLVTANVATDGDDVFSGIFNPGLDASPGSLPTTFNSAAVSAFPSAVPEPSVGLLLASGFIALAALRRR